MDDKPLVVQSDRTLLLDVHSPSAEDCRGDLIGFAELIKSPEHMHTYQITSLSLWNAAAAGISTEEVIKVLKKWSRYEIPNSVLYFISEMEKRYGALVLDEYDDKYYILSVSNENFARQIESNSSTSTLLRPNDSKSFLVPKLLRGELKLKLIKLGFPIEDKIPMRKGGSLQVELKDNFTLRPYQIGATNSTLTKDGGYGCIVLPCGSGKTIVGLIAIAKLKTRTLILAPNVAAVHQWIRELVDKTTLTVDQIGEFTGEKKEIKAVTVCTYQSLMWRENTEAEYLNLRRFANENWGLIIYDEVHMLPAPVFRISAELQSVSRIGLTATLVREDGLEDNVFSLVGPKRYDVPWSELEKQGFIATAYCHEIKIPLPPELELEYALAINSKKNRIAAENPDKIKVVKKLIEEHPDDHILIIGQYLDQLNLIKKEFGYPMITGATSNKRRDTLYDDFRSGKERILIVSKVANFAIDLPDASMAIQISGTFGSRQEEAQRLGRILRPKERDSHFYTIVTKYSTEEDFAQNRQKFLCEQGYTYSVEDFSL